MVWNSGDCLKCFELFCMFFGGGLFCWWCIFLIEKNGTKRIKTNSVANKQIIGYCKMNFLHTTFLHYTIKQPSGWYENIHFSILWMKSPGFCIKNLENFQKFLLKPGI